MTDPGVQPTVPAAQPGTPPAQPGTPPAQPGTHPPGSQTGAAGYLALPVGAFLQALSAASPDPGGGSAAALTVALAAGLCAMTAGLSARHLPADEAPGIVSRAQRLRDRAAPLAEADAESYRAVLAARRHRPQSVDAAMSAASTVPLTVTEIGAQVATLAVMIAQRGNPNVRGDAITAAVLAAAGSRAAAELVRINLVHMKDDDRPARAQRHASQAARLAATVALPSLTLHPSDQNLGGTSERTASRGLNCQAGHPPEPVHRS